VKGAPGLGATKGGAVEVKGGACARVRGQVRRRQMQRPFVAGEKKLKNRKGKTGKKAVKTLLPQCGKRARFAVLE